MQHGLLALPEHRTYQIPQDFSQDFRMLFPHSLFRTLLRSFLYNQARRFHCLLRCQHGSPDLCRTHSSRVGRSRQILGGRIETELIPWPAYRSCHLLGTVPDAEVLSYFSVPQILLAPASFARSYGKSPRSRRRIVICIWSHWNQEQQSHLWPGPQSHPRRDPYHPVHRVDEGAPRRSLYPLSRLF